MVLTLKVYGFNETKVRSYQPVPTTKKDGHMKKVLTITVLALSFATGFTCSKQTPDMPPPEEMPAPPQEEMAAPPAEGGMEEPPTDGSGG